MYPCALWARIQSGTHLLRKTSLFSSFSTLSYKTSFVLPMKSAIWHVRKFKNNELSMRCSTSLLSFSALFKEENRNLIKNEMKKKQGSERWSPCFINAFVFLFQTKRSRRRQSNLDVSEDFTAQAFQVPFRGSDWIQTHFPYNAFPLKSQVDCWNSPIFRILFFYA